MALEQLAEIKKGIDGIGKAHTEFAAAFETYKKDRDVLTEEKLKKISEDFGVKHETLQREMDAIKARESHPPQDPEESRAKASTAKFWAKMRMDVQQESVKAGNAHGFPGFSPEDTDPGKYVKSFWKAIRTSSNVDRGISQHALNVDEAKDLAVGSDPDGGYFLAPPTISQTVVMRIFETSPMRELSSVLQIGTREYIVPEDPSDVGAGWVAERQARTATQTFNPARKIIPAQEMYAEPAITQQLLEDGLFDIEKYLIGRLADKFSRVENTAFVNGTGVGQPRGFMTYPTTVVSTGNFTGWNVLEQINSGSAGAFTYTGLVRLITALKENFQNNAKFLIRRQSIYHIMILTDSNGRLVFQPILNGNFNKTPLLGYDLRYATDMPDVNDSFGSPVTAVNPMAFGDFSQGYQIVDRVGLSMIRDNLTAKPNILLYTRKRTGGDVVNFDAIKIHSLQ